MTNGAVVLFMRTASQNTATHCGDTPLDLADGSRRVPHGQDVRSKVPSDHSTRAHHRVLTNRHARTHDGATAQPDVVSYADRLASLKLVASRLGLDGVNRRQQLDIRTNLYVVADRDLSNIEGDHTKVRECARTHMDMQAVVDVQRRANDGLLPERPEPVAEDLSCRGGIGLPHLGASFGELLRPLHQRTEFFVIRGVPVTGQHPLALAPWLFAHAHKRTQRTRP